MNMSKSDEGIVKACGEVVYTRQAACGSHLGYGVIGSPTDSDSVSLGSSPGTPAIRGGCKTGHNKKIKEYKTYKDVSNG